MCRMLEFVLSQQVRQSRVVRADSLASKQKLDISVLLSKKNVA
jgi:hypothetical protein